MSKIGIQRMLNTILIKAIQGLLLTFRANVTKHNFFVKGAKQFL